MISLDLENKIDHFAGQWLTNKRCGTDGQNGLVLARVYELIDQGYPVCVGTFERAYLELVDSGDIKPIKEKLAVAAAPAAHVPLSVEEYRHIPASMIAKRYMREPQFKADVDRLIARKEI